MLDTFLNAWAVEASLQVETLEESWTSATALTAAVGSGDDSVLANVAKRMELRRVQEYYSLDHAFYLPRDKLEVLPESDNWIRRFQIVVEHENKFDMKLLQEVSRLLMVDVRLRVLITYYPDSEKFFNQILTKIFQAIQGDDRSQQFSHDRSFLILVGSANYDESRLSWLPLLYGTNSWTPLQEVSVKFRRKKLKL